MRSPGRAASPETGISPGFSPRNSITWFHGDRLKLLSQIPSGGARLCVTSPPYNIGKKYEKKEDLHTYLEGQRQTLRECVRILDDDGSLCWQVGNHVRDGEIFPLDIFIYGIAREFGLKLRNRIIWCFEHGLNASNRLSGRYETILWFTKSDKYIFNLDPIRVPQKYPGKKHFKGPKVGQYSCNPLGKNPGDIWTIPNVKHNHIEKTEHPCQFPIELIERLVLALTNVNDLVVDPYAGVASALCAAVMRHRRAAGAETSEQYIKIGRDRLAQLLRGELRSRPIDRRIYEPDPRTKITQNPWEVRQPPLLFTAD